MEKQMRLFGVPDIKSHRFRLPMQYAEIKEGKGKYPLWFRGEANSLKQLKEIAIRIYNKQKGYNLGIHDIKFGKIKWEKKKKISEKEKKRQGFIADKSKPQVEEILKSLKINENERLEKWKLKNPK